ncbi:MAG: serine hydrolase domain-containing protein [Tahibacter sp.]
MRNSSSASRIYALFIGVFMAVTASAAIADDDGLTARAQALLHEQFAADGPGAAVALLQNGKPLLITAVGLADIKNHTALNSESVFDLASVSKQFTAASILRLAQEKQLELDAPVRRYLPDFAVQRKGREITVSDLLHHVSGLASYTSDEFREGDKAFARLTTETQLRWLNGTTPRRSPGQQFEYNNSGYALLALIIERVSGMPYSDFVTTQLFKPVGMDHTQVLDRLGKRIAGGVRGYTTNDGTPNSSFVATQITGDGNIYSSMNDLLAWCHALDGSTILSPESKRKMWSNGHLDSGKPINDEGDGYGLGWFVGSDASYVFHSGTWDGTATYLRHDIRRKLWVIVLSNDEDADVATIADGLLGLVE